MSINILNNFIRNARDSSRTLLSTIELKRSRSQTHADVTSQNGENEGALRGRSSLWRSIAGGKDGWRLGLDQADNILNYYKKRWIPCDGEKVQAESEPDGEAEVGGFAAGKSLYSQWATKGPSEDRAKPHRPLKTTDFVMVSKNDPFRHQTERMVSAMTSPQDGVETKDRCLDRLKRPISAPVLWQMDKSPLDLLTNNDGDTTSRTKRGPDHSRGSKKETTALSRCSSQDELSDDTCEDELDERTSSNHLLREKHRSRPTTSPSIFNPDDIPLFDVNTLKKKYVFGARLGHYGPER